MARPDREIRALFDDVTITVYQAYSPEIAFNAVAAGRFCSPFKLDRMTWIKPSFLWVMYRSGWAHKQGQERVLSIQISRRGFESALSRACPTRFDPTTSHSYLEWRKRLADSPARYQWDPERDPSGSSLPYKSIQLGLSGHLVHEYVNHWIVAINDITPMVREVFALSAVERRAMTPKEETYPLSQQMQRHLGILTHSRHPLEFDRSDET